MAVLVTTCALVVMMLALRPHGHAAPPPPGVSRIRVATAPRVPAPGWGLASRSELRGALQDALAPALQDAQAWSCVVIAQDGTVLYDDRASDAVAAASTQKLIVTDAALRELGTQFRYDTLFAASAPAAGGTLPGDLFVVGSGDPSLRSSDLRAGVAALRARGMTSIHGNLVVDASAIAGGEINPYWNPDDANEDFMAPTSGISIDEDTVAFNVAGTTPGEAAQVHVDPRSGDVRYDGSVETADADDVIIAGTDLPNDFRLAGDVPAGVTETFYLPVHGIAQYAADVLARMLASAGIALDGKPVAGTASLDAQVLWAHRSAPLTQLLGHMLVFSDNHFAEQLMRTLGGWHGERANDADGLAVERRVLAAQGIPAPGLHLVDGSGLAHANRVAAITLARILAYYDAQPAGNMLYPLLARGGKDGTLKSYQFDAARDRVRAKTGHLDGVSALAGYVETRKHGRVAFAFLIDGSPADPDSAMVSAVDRLAQR